MPKWNVFFGRFKALLAISARAFKYDLVTCAWLWSSADNTTPYRPMEGEPRFGHIDIGGFTKLLL